MTLTKEMEASGIAVSHAIGQKIMLAFADLGLTEDMPDTPFCVAPTFETIEIVRGDNGSIEYILFTIDMSKLPTGVVATRLTSRRAVHHISGVLGKQATVLNTTGVTYAIAMGNVPPAMQRLPEPGATTMNFVDIRRNLDGNDNAILVGTLPEGITVGGRFRSIDCGNVRLAISNLSSMGHCLIGGMTQSGKTTWLHTAIASLLATSTPETLWLALIDLKVVEMSMWAKVENMLCPIATEEKDVFRVLKCCDDEMARRQELLLRYRCRSIKDFNDMLAYDPQDDLQPIPYLLLIIDELADIALALGKTSKAYAMLVRLCQKGASMGVYVWGALQNPLTEVIGTLARGQFQTRICFRVEERGQSQATLNISGAEKIPVGVRGRFLLKLPGNRLLPLQSVMLAGLRDCALDLSFYDDDFVWPCNDPNDIVQQFNDASDIAEQREILQAALRDGMTKKDIQQRIWGYSGGTAYDNLQAVLSSGG